MDQLNMSPEAVDEQSLAIESLGQAGEKLPTLSQLAGPTRQSMQQLDTVAKVGRDAPDPASLRCVHLFNDATGNGLVDVPEHPLLSPALTGVKAPIVVALGSPFPMIRSHKVLAAYSCLVPHLGNSQVTDPTALWARQEAIWK